MTLDEDRLCADAMCRPCRYSAASPNQCCIVRRRGLSPSLAVARSSSKPIERSDGANVQSTSDLYHCGKIPRRNPAARTQHHTNAPGADNHAQPKKHRSELEADLIVAYSQAVRSNPEFLRWARNLRVVATVQAVDSRRPGVCFRRCYLAQSTTPRTRAPSPGQSRFSSAVRQYREQSNALCQAAMCRDVSNLRLRVVQRAGLLPDIQWQSVHRQHSQDRHGG